MAPKASQRPATQQYHSHTKGKKTAPAASQRQNGKRRARDEEEEEEEEEEEDQDVDMDGENDDEDNPIEKMAQDFVRLALFTEYKHGPLRRDEINKKVLDKNTRSFKAVLARSQEILNDIFGMELVPLPNQAQRDKVTADDKEGREATGIKKKPVNAAPRAWILRNKLSQAFIQAAAESDRDLRRQEEEDWEAMRDNVERPEKAPGTLMAWQDAEEIGLMGILYVILSLLLVNGRSLNEPQLRSYLKKLRLQGNTQLPTSPAGKTYTLDTYLTQLVKLSYLDRIRSQLGAQPQATQGGKRGRGRGNDEEGDVSWEWKWGARAETEIGEKAVATFVCDMYLNRTDEAADDDDDDEEDEEEEAPRGGRGRANGRERANGARQERQTKAQKAKQQFERLLREVERAAGGDLVA